MATTSHPRSAHPSSSSSNRLASRDALLAAARTEEDEFLETSLFGSRDRDSAAAAAHPRLAAASAPPIRDAWHDDDDDEGGDFSASGAAALDDDSRAARDRRGVGRSGGVALAKTSRLRKLRRTVDEDVVSRAEAESRLRDAFAARSLAVAPASRHQLHSKWATLPPEGGDDDAHLDGSGGDDDSGDETAAAAAAAVPAGGLVRGSIPTSGGARLSLTRLRDANRSAPCRAVVAALAWHPEGRILATASLEKTLRFFAIDGKANASVASVYFPDLPMSSAAWAGDGSEVIVTGRRPFLYSYDVEAGAATRLSRILGANDAARSLESCVVSPDADPAASVIAVLANDGCVVLLSGRTKQRIATLKMNGSVRAAAFTRDPLLRGSAPSDARTGFNHLLTAGGEGDVYRWDMRQLGRCLSRHSDEGSTGITALAATPDGSAYAVGSKSGIVNIYDAAAVCASASASADYSSGGSGSSTSVRGLFSFAGGSASTGPKPLHVCEHLTTVVDALTMNCDGSLLAASSRSIRDALRVFHTASGKASSNWPTPATPLSYVSAAAFSPRSGFLTVGNDRGRALLYRLHKYAEA